MQIIRMKHEDAVYRKLKNAIRKRYIKQGNKLVENVLARKLGVSRTPVRSAIKRLEAEGLVYSIPNRGAFVITPTPKEIEETYLVRGGLERMAARLTSRTISRTQIEGLNLLIQKEKKVFGDKDLDGYEQVNNKFHLTIAKLSGNNVLHSYIKELIDRTRIFLILCDPFLKMTFSPSLDAHRKIVDALAEHDPDLASRAVAEHIQSSVDELDTTELMPDDYLAL